MRRGLLVLNWVQMQAHEGSDTAEGEDAVLVLQNGAHFACKDVASGPADPDITFRPALSQYHIFIAFYFFIDVADLTVEFHFLVEQTLQMLADCRELTHKRALIN